MEIFQVKPNEEKHFGGVHIDTHGPMYPYKVYAYFKMFYFATTFPEKL